MRLLAILVFLTATPGLAQTLSASGQRAYEDYKALAPQKAFAVGADGSGYTWAGSSGADPARPVEQAMSNCENRTKGKCMLYAVNNIELAGRDWRSAAPPAGPAIGRLRSQPYWQTKGPQAVEGLMVWSHGYRAGHDATSGAAQPHTGRFSLYDFYRFDREWIRDWPGDATALAEAVRQAKAMGYKRVVLTGQSAGGWVSLAATMRGAPVDGVIAVASAHHGETKDMRDVTLARSEWQQIVKGIKSGPRLVVVNFADDTYDVGGRMDDAKAAFAANGVAAIVIAEPAGFKGHGAGNSFDFNRKFGACMKAFVDTGARQAPCI
jgi:pimeloyl-ACP methyl ester carboxylesterase